MEQATATKTFIADNGNLNVYVVVIRDLDNEDDMDMYTFEQLEDAVAFVKSIGLKFKESGWEEELELGNPVHSLHYGICIHHQHIRKHIL